MNELERKAYEEGEPGSAYADERAVLRRAMSDVPLSTEEVDAQWSRFLSAAGTSSPRRARPGGRLLVAAALLACVGVLWIVANNTGDDGSRGPATPQEPKDPAGEEVRRLVGKLSSTDASERDAAAAELRKRGPQVLPILEEESGKAAGPDLGKALKEIIEALRSTVAARVNDEFITWEEVDRSLRIAPQQITRELRLAQLRQMAQERLYLQHARQAKIVASEEEVEAAVRKERDRFGDEDQYVRSLRLAGQTKADRRVFFQNRLAMQKLFRERGEKVEVTDEEVRRYKETHKGDVDEPGIRAILQNVKMAEATRRLTAELLRGARIEPADLFKND